MIGSLGWQELLIILVILALLFGAARVADLGGALGKGIREFRQEARAEDDPEEERAERDASGPAADTADTAETAKSSSSEESESSG